MRARRVTRKAPIGDINPTGGDRARYARVREVGRRQSGHSSTVVDAWYDTQFHQVGLEFRTGARVFIPQRLVVGLERAPMRDLVTVTVSPAGDAVSWRSLDVDVAVPGLVEGALGRRLFESIVTPAIDPGPGAQPAILAPTNNSIGTVKPLAILPAMLPASLARV